MLINMNNNFSFIFSTIRMTTQFKFELFKKFNKMK
jgi:hypothetical protein